MSYNLEKILERADADLQKRTEHRTASESLEAYQRFRRLEEHRLRLRISSGARGREVVRQRSDLVDILFRRLFAQVCAETIGKASPAGFAASAFGGYGRREMNPFSDVDIMFLHAGRKTTPQETAAVREITRILWDIGFKVGHAVRSVPEAVAQANEDLQTKTSMLESRYLCGDRELFQKFRAEFEKKCVKGKEDAYLAWRLVNQRELHADTHSFANALKSALRQDPDVVLIGEIRDQETAQIAVQAALTGHLVLSTLHTNDAASAVTRLTDMEIEPFLVSSAVQAIIAQRLVRLLCPHCKEPYEPEEAQWLELGLAKEAAGPIFQAKGCEKGLETGYRGRSGIYEFMRMTESIKGLLLQTSDSNQISKAARKEGMVSLREDGIQKVIEGKTTVSEVLRVTQV